MMRAEASDGDSFTRVFAAALATRGISLSGLRRRLIDTGNPVAIATLSYWRAGERVPEGASSLAAVEEIERILELPTGTLIALIPERVRLGTVHAPVTPFSREQVRQALDETMQLLDAPALTNTRDLTSHIVNDVAADGILRRRDASTLVQSVVPEVVDHVTYALVSEAEVVDPPEIVATGARLVRSLLDPSEHVYVFVLRLDRPLTPGASTMLGVTLIDRKPPTPQAATGKFVTRPIRDLVLWTRFHPDAIPDWIEEIESVEATGQEDVRSLRPEASVHQSRRDFGPGLLAIRWGYHDRPGASKGS